MKTLIAVILLVSLFSCNASNIENISDEVSVPVVWHWIVTTTRDFYEGFEASWHFQTTWNLNKTCLDHTFETTSVEGARKLIDAIIRFQSRTKVFEVIEQYITPVYKRVAEECRVGEIIHETKQH